MEVCGERTLEQLSFSQVGQLLALKVFEFNGVGKPLLNKSQRL